MFISHFTNSMLSSQINLLPPDNRLEPMLILTRRVSETLYIGDDISITIQGITGNQVRIAIKAPKDVAIAREELLVNRSSKDKNRPD